MAETDEFSGGEQLEQLCEQLVHAADGLVVRRRSFEQLDPLDQGKLIGVLDVQVTLIVQEIEKIDRELTRILEERLRE